MLSHAVPEAAPLRRAAADLEEVVEVFAQAGADATACGVTLPKRRSKAI
jgi:hypothetical protein